MTTNLSTGKTFLLLFLLTIPSFVRLLRPGYFSMQDDVQAFRLLEFDKCVKTFQIPCRWIPDGGAGYGYPLFNYYPPLPYAVGEGFHLLGLSILDSVKLLFILGFIGAAFSMYLLTSSLWGKASGFLSAMFYLYAPYRSVDSYVRGDLSEFWALSLAPLVLLGVYLVVAKKRGYLLITLSLTALLLTHLLTLVMLAPFLIFWCAYLLLKTKSKQSLRTLAVGSLFALAMSGFSWIPSLLEKDLVTLNTITQGFFDFRGHFASLDQLFLSRFWGYGASLFQKSDMSLQIGHLHWLIPASVALVIILFKKKKAVYDHFFFIATIFGFVYAFMAHNQSTPIWLSLPFLSFLQFPWRFVGLSVLALSMAVGAIRIQSRFLVILLIAAVIGLNVGYFKEDIWYPSMTDTQKLSQSEITKQNISGLKDYWPASGTSFPDLQAPLFPKFLIGGGKVIARTIGSSSFQYTLNVEAPSSVEFPIVYFPNWRIVNKSTGAQIPIKVTQPLGLISANFPKGEIEVFLKLFNTPAREFANILSVASVILFLLILRNSYHNKYV